MKILWAISILGLLSWSAVACNGSDGAEQESVPPTVTSIPPTLASIPPTQTTEAFESPLLPTPTQPLLTVETGFGGAKGVVATSPASWAGRDLFVWFSPFYSGEQADQGIFVLDPEFHPKTQVAADGYFQLGDIPPAKYVVVIGPTPQEALATQEDDRPKIFEILEGEILDLGLIHLQD